MPKVHSITPKRLIDPNVSKEELEVMKLGGVYYFTNLGISNSHISTMLGMELSDVDAAVDRIKKTGWPLKPETVEKEEVRDPQEVIIKYLQKTLKKDPNTPIKTLQEGLEKLGQPISSSTIQRWIKKLELKNDPLVTEKDKKTPSVN